MTAVAAIAPAGPLPVDRQRQWACGSATALLCAAALLSPLLAQRLPVMPFFFLLYLIFLAVMQSATATFLLVRARIEANFPLAVLAAAYVFAAPLVIGAGVSLPESVILRGIGTSQASSYCLTLARVGFGIGLALFAFVSLPAIRRRPIVVPFWLPSAVACASVAIALTVSFGGGLPAMLVADNFTFVHTVLCAAATTLYVLAVAMLALRGRTSSPLEYWTALAATAAAVESLLAVSVGERYSIGWYTTRAFGAIASAAVLFAIATEAGRVARALHQRLSAQEALRTLAEMIPQIVWTAAPSGAVDWANKRWFDYTGPSDGALASRWPAVVHPRDFAQLKRRLPQMLAEKREFELDLRFRGHDGVYRWFLTRVVPMRDGRGRVVRWYGTSTNVDEQRRRATHLRELYGREQRVAANLQAAFAPANFPLCAGLAFSQVYLPAATGVNVGGDWYDAFRVGEHRIAVSLGDVSGHGIDAAVRMLRVRELLRAAAFDDPAPSVVLERAARSLGAEEPEHTVTALYGVVDIGLAEFTYASAGHPPPAFLRDGIANSLPFGGLPLGVALRPSYADHTLGLRQGDVVSLYTDGLIEAGRDPVEGERRLFELLESGIIDARALASKLVQTDRQLDDIAVATIAVGRLNAGDRTPQPWHLFADQAALASGARASFALYFSACGANAEELMNAEHALGELLGNVVRHAPGPVEIELTWQDRKPFLSVSDRGTNSLGATGGDAPALHAESGRGFHMLCELGMQPVASAREGGGTRVLVPLSCRSFERASAGV